jgi:hypothetical protein
MYNLLKKFMVITTFIDLVFAIYTMALFNNILIVLKGIQL